jgi:hypothetical protein
MSSELRCTVSPISGFQSSNLSSKITSFDKLAERILRNLGYPSINVELHRDQLYDNISIACEMFTKFAGYTREYLIFNSNLYVPNYGLKLDSLFTAKSNENYLTQLQNRNSTTATENPLFSKYIDNQKTVYVANSAIPAAYFTPIPTLSGTLSAGAFPNEIFSLSSYEFITSSYPQLAPYFTRSARKNITQLGSEIADANPVYMNSFDYDIMDYRKVISVTEFEEGSNQGVNTLFTLEQTLAQQTYFSYAMGNYGFDLVSWYTLKEWLDTREKLLAIRRDLKFDERTQYLQMYPQPGSSRFYGVVSCYLERPIRDLVKEQWVYEYAVALSKIAAISASSDR